MGQVCYMLKITHNKRTHGLGVLSTEDDTQQMKEWGRCDLLKMTHTKCGRGSGVLFAEDDTDQM